DGLVAEGPEGTRTVDVPHRLLTYGPEDALHNVAARVGEHERGTELDTDQSRPHARRAEHHGGVRRTDHARPDGCRDLPDSVRARAFSARGGRHLGGNR